MNRHFAHFTNMDMARGQTGNCSLPQHHMKETRTSWISRPPCHAVIRRLMLDCQPTRSNDPSDNVNSLMHPAEPNIPMHLSICTPTRPTVEFHHNSGGVDPPACPASQLRSRAVC
jgi:hypothetical protein